MRPKIDFLDRSSQRRAGGASTTSLIGVFVAVVALIAGAGFLYYLFGVGDDEQTSKSTTVAKNSPDQSTAASTIDKSTANKNATENRANSESSKKFVPRRTTDTSGFFQLAALVKPWGPNASLKEVAAAFENRDSEIIREIDARIALGGISGDDEMKSQLVKVLMLNYQGKAEESYETLAQLRTRLVSDPALARDWLYTIIHLQGVMSLRRGETENCVMCRGESSCILPIVPAAIHINPLGSRQAIVHFTEYLEQFPNDFAVAWTLNVAHMTLGEHPDKVDPRYLISLEHYQNSEFDLGTFRDIGHIVGLNKFNQSGGAVLEDFNGDGLLDVVVTSIDARAEMAIYWNMGDGRFADVTQSAGLGGQLGALNLGQTDYNNDGLVDIFIPRGAWFNFPVRPSLLRNDGAGRFTDVTREAGLLEPFNSNSCAWADYDNDGLLDLFVACERQTNRLYHNEGNGEFTEVARLAGVQQDAKIFCKAGVWLDFDNDDFPDLFLNNLEGIGKLYHNNRNCTFTDVSDTMGIDGPKEGFPCWAWDYDNDGWIDIFATSYFRSIDGVVRGMLGEPFDFPSNRLFHNNGGKKFEDRTKAAGLDQVYAAMGCNFGDFDNDGYLDMYLGTGAPGYEFLVPNRMFKNVAGQRFSDVTAKSRTGNLQKGHGVACGDWDRDGNVDVFIQLGGPAIGDKYHNVLFQNPGHDNRWVTLKLIGRQTNRLAIGARIKIVTAGSTPQTIYRHVTSGSSFGANPIEQTIGLGKAERIAELEIHWPTSGATQIFRDVDVDQMLQIVEFDSSYIKTPTKCIEWNSAEE